MENIVNYITEKFKISSKTVSKNASKTKFEITFDKENIDFPDGDLDQIIEFAESLQIRPDKIEYFYISNTIRFRYNSNNSPRIEYGICFTYINSGKTQGYRIVFLDHDSYIYQYPEFPKVESLQECFDYIDKKFHDVIKRRI